MLRDDLVYIKHMLDAAREAVALTAGRGHTDYDKDRTLRLALTHLIQLIGEAARKVSDAFRSQYPDIPWPDIVGMRHRIVHDYIDVDENIVWDTAHESLPTLIEALEQIVPDE